MAYAKHELEVRMISLNQMSKPKVIVILGQTSSGKSALSVKIAKKFNGEVISADSRQVYKGINIGTGKITKEEMLGIPHHLIDVVSPKEQFSVALYKELAEQKIKEILARGKTPIICGGTGFYIDAVTKGIILPLVPPNYPLRKKLALMSDRSLMLKLKKLDPIRAKNIDPKNKVRIIRAIEIAKALGKVPQITEETPPYQFIKIGLKISENILKKRIETRLKTRLGMGMVKELQELRKNGVPWKRLTELGFDQKFIALYLQKKITNEELLENLIKNNWQYAKRQMTWFKRDQEIKWFTLSEYSKITKYLEKNFRVPFPLASSPKSLAKQK